MTQSPSTHRLTIAIACFNQGRFLQDAIESAVYQTRSADEIIVVDDGSTDNTADVAKKNPNIIYRWQSNSGLAAARNTALNMAFSDFILFLDADDTLTPNAIEDSLKCIEAHPQAAFVYGGYREVDSSGEVLFERLPDLTRRGYEGLLAGNHIAMHGTVLYRLAILKKSGGFDTTLRACEDYDVFLRLSRDYPIASYASVAAHYRRHGSNMTANYLRMLISARTVLLRQQPYLRGHPKLEKASHEGGSFFEGYYGPLLADTVIHGLFFPKTFGKALKLFLDGVHYDLRFTGWMLKVLLRKLNRRMRAMR